MITLGLSKLIIAILGTGVLVGLYLDDKDKSSK